MIKSLIIFLTLTVLIENAGAAMLGVRKKKDFLLITLVNIVTNPLLVQSLNILSFVLKIKPQWYLILLLEAMVVAAEGLLYQKRLCCNKINPFVFSLILNSLSYFGGSVIYEIFTRIF